MATAGQVDSYRATIESIVLASAGDAKALLGEVANVNPVVFREQLEAALPTMLTPYVSTAAMYSAEWYEDLRRASVGGRFAAVVADELDPGLVSGVARYAVAPMFQQSGSSVLSLLMAGIQKTVANAGRFTIATNVAMDAADVRYARVPKVGCCAFCAVLASRGASYGSARSAGGAVGRGVESHPVYSATGRYLGMRGGGVRFGTQSAGEKYHSNCRCVATPVWPGESVPYDLAFYESMHASSAGYSMQATTSAMRSQFELK